MREIKFRAICSSAEYGHEQYDGNMIYGSLWIKNELEYFIFCDEENIWLEIDKNTLGQFTGLRDGIGKEIYEGDVVVYSSRMAYAVNGAMAIEGGSIVWNKHGFKIDLFGYTYEEERFYSINQNKLKVIGNIHENPELLK